MTEENKEQSEAIENENADAQVEEKKAEGSSKENETDEITPENSEENEGSEEDLVEKMKHEVDAAKDKYLRLFSEFENFRRRTARERLELIQTSTEGLMVEILPILDDFARAKSSIEDGSEIKSIREGVDLIDNKLRRVLEQKGLKAMNVKQGDEFDSDLHEAVSQIPAPKKKLVGKVIETIEDGYFLGEKVIRYAKVVIGGE